MSFPPLGEEDGTEGPMIIEAEMGGHFVHRVYVDGGASSEVLYEHCFIKLRKEIRDQMVPATTHLIGFSGETIWPLGQIALLVKIGDEVHSTSAWMNFMSSRVIPMECAMISGPSIQSPAVNQDIYRLSTDMTGVPRSIAEHRLNIQEGYSPVRQKKRGQAPERNKVIQEEVEIVDDIKMKMKVLSLPSPRCIKDVQKLNGKLASLNRFLSKSAEKSLPFFKTLKKCTKKSDFQWTPEAEEAFKQMKKLIAELPTLTAPREHEELIIYLAAAKEAISAVLMTDREGKQIPCIANGEFQSDTGHSTDECMQLRKQIDEMIKAGKLSQFIKELKQNDKLKAPKKGESYGKDKPLAILMIQPWEEGSPDELMAEPEVLPEPWTLFTDGSSCVNGSRAGLILTNLEGAEFTYAMRFRFEATNNEAEYEALIAGLRIAEQIGVKNLQAHVDSRLVANQVNGSYVAKESGM
ncbi:reverse transcriptase domain-containing protein, partial [Tanacetum coccineum]